MDVSLAGAVVLAVATSLPWAHQTSVLYGDVIQSTRGLDRTMNGIVILAIAVATVLAILIGIGSKVNVAKFMVVPVVIATPILFHDYRNLTHPALGTYDVRQSVAPGFWFAVLGLAFVGLGGLIGFFDSSAKW